MSFRPLPQESTSFKCTECLEHFSVADRLLLHLHQHVTGGSPTHQSDCNRSEDTPRLLQEAETFRRPSNITGSGGLECPVCHKFFTSRYFQYHYFTHTGEKPYGCDRCPQTFAHPSNLRGHSVRAHGHVLPVIHYECTACHKEFTTARDFRHHRSMHAKGPRLLQAVGTFQRPTNITGTGGFECPVCHKLFSNKSHFQFHYFTHTGEKPFGCDGCPQRYAHPSNLRSHIRRSHGHAFTVTHECTICYKKFITARGLRRHGLTHAGQTTLNNECQENFGTIRRHYHHFNRAKVHECTVCHKRFSDVTRLRYHTFTHSGDKPFGCEFCPVKYTNPSNLRAHIRRAHGLTSEIRYNCTVCFKKFLNTATLCAHFSTHTMTTYNERLVSDVMLSGAENLRPHTPTLTVGMQHVSANCEVTAADTLEGHGTNGEDLHAGVSTVDEPDEGLPTMNYSETGSVFPVHITTWIGPETVSSDLPVQVKTEVVPTSSNSFKTCKGSQEKLPEDSNESYKGSFGDSQAYLEPRVKLEFPDATESLPSCSNRPQLRIRQPVKTLECTNCLEVFTRLRDLQFHTCPRLEKRKTHPCTLCHKKFRTASQLMKHTLSHLHKDGDACGVCDKSCVAGFLKVRFTT